MVPTIYLRIYLAELHTLIYLPIPNHPPIINLYIISNSCILIDTLSALVTHEIHPHLNHLKQIEQDRIQLF